MLRSVCITLVLVLYVSAKSTHYSSSSSCEVSDWTSWGKCVRTPHCNAEWKPAHSYKLKEDTNDMGSVVMAIGMKEKEHEWKEVEDCREANTCPELALIPSEGRKDCKDGLAGRYPCKHISMMSFVDFESLGHPQDIRQHGDDIWGWTDPQTGDEYAIMCMYGGTSFVRVTDVENPKVLGFLPTRTTPSSWHDVKVVNDHAYIVSEADDHGMLVFDMTRLRNKSSYSVLEADSEYLKIGNVHNIVMNQESQSVFIVGATDGDYDTCLGGLHMIDVSEPKSPKFTGCYAEDGYTHDAECVIYRGPDTKYQGREICFNYNENSLTLVDITNRTNPVMISKRGYENYGYTHQGWLTEDHTMLVMDDEKDEKYIFEEGYTRTHVWDVKDLENPTLKSTFVSAETAIDHNQYIKGAYTYQSNYAAGLRVLHIDQQEHKLSEVAYFDTLPSGTTVEFKGAWSNYPFFKSGNIAVSSIDYGLFMVKPDYDAMDKEVEKNSVSGQQSRTRKINSAIKPADCPNLEQRRNCQPAGC